MGWSIPLAVGSGMVADSAVEALADALHCNKTLKESMRKTARTVTRMTVSAVLHDPVGVGYSIAHETLQNAAQEVFHSTVHETAHNAANEAMHSSGSEVMHNATTNATVHVTPHFGDSDAASSSDIGTYQQGKIPVPEGEYQNVITGEIFRGDQVTVDNYGCWHTTGSPDDYASNRFPTDPANIKRTRFK